MQFIIDSKRGHGTHKMSVIESSFILESSIFSTEVQFDEFTPSPLEFLKGLTAVDFFVILEIDPENEFCRFDLEKTSRHLVQLVQSSSLEDYQKKAVYKWLTNLEVDSSGLDFEGYVDQWATMPNTLDSSEYSELDTEDIFEISDLISDHGAQFTYTDKGLLFKDDLWDPFQEQLKG